MVRVVADMLGTLGTTVGTLVLGLGDWMAVIGVLDNDLLMDDIVW